MNKSAAYIAWPVLFAAIFLAYIFKATLVQPPAVDPDHPFNTARAFERLTRILGDEAPHPIDSDANDAVRDRLVAEITALGFTPFIRDSFHCIDPYREAVRCARLQNIGFWVTEPGPNAVLVLSHYDSVPAGPGAADDGAGVAASLEIAAILKDRPLSRPLMVLITDGEEMGLIGADQFVKHDPYAEMIGAVVNMEARGVEGLTSLIQTSRPNGRDLHALHDSPRMAAASSLNADIYELLPNDTDLTEFLALDIDAANFAFAGGERFYHTPADNLANLDQQAFFHLGASGLAATETFLAQTGTEAERQWTYTVLVGSVLLQMPIWLCWMSLTAGLIASIALFWRTRQSPLDWTAACAPIVAILVGLAFATGTSWVVDWARIEPSFATAHPLGFRSLHAAAGLLGAGLAYHFMARTAQPKTILAGTGIWFTLSGIAMSALVVGGAILFAPVAILLAVACLATLLGYGFLGRLISAAGALLFALIALPLAALGESGLLIEASAPFVITAITLVLLAAPAIWRQDGLHKAASRVAIFGAAGVLGLGLLVSLSVKAYTPDAPRHISLVHLTLPELETPVWSVRGAEALPEPMRAQAPFEAGSLPIFGGPRQIAPAPPADLGGVTVLDRSEREDGDTRILSLVLSAPQVDRLNVAFLPETGMTAATVNGVEVDLDDGTLREVVCFGRSCRALSLQLAFPAEVEAPELAFIGFRYGLGPQGHAIAAARPDWAIARQNGDMRMFYETLALDTD